MNHGGYQYDKKYLLLMGGVDINPAIYKQKPHNRTQHPNLTRDAKEIEMFLNAREENIPIIGVCRGAQLLCALNGGTLYQHTDDHSISHSITTIDGTTFGNVAAGHHQMMNPKGKYVVYGFDGREKYTIAYDEVGDPHKIHHAPEIIWWPDTKCLAIQPHPEWMPSSYPFNMWLNNLIFNLTEIKGVF